MAADREKANYQVFLPICLIRCYRDREELVTIHVCSQWLKIGVASTLLAVKADNDWFFAKSVGTLASDVIEFSR